ncbi:MAG: AraC family transcriptional regulator [Bacteroidales bacterium]|nr:AraC family transcriptional regulator [Bacteroidales bacterium]
MKKDIFIILFLLTSYLQLHTSFSFAAEKEPLTKEQTKTIDSLKQLLKISDNKGKAKVYNELAEKYSDISYTTALQYANEALKISMQTNNNKEKANALRIIGFINYNTGNNKIAYNYYQQSLIIYTQLSDKKGIANVNNNIGNINRVWNNYEEALKKYNKSLQVYQELNDKIDIAKLLNNIGNVYIEKNQYKEAEDSYQKALIILDKLNNKEEISRTTNNLGNLYLNWNKNEIALKYYQKSLKISEELKDKKLIAATLNNMGIIYSNMGKYNEALKTYTRALNFQEELKNNPIIAKINGNIGVLYSKENDFKKALYYHKKSYGLIDKKSKESIAIALHNIGNIYIKLGNYNVALGYLQQSIKITDSVNKFGDGNIANYRDIADLYKKMNDYKTANKYLSQYYVLKDSVYNKETHKQIMEINTKYETEKKDKEIKLLNAQKQLNEAKYNKKAIIFILIIFIFCSILIASLLYINKIKADKNLAFKNLEIVKTEKEILESKHIQLLNERKTTNEISYPRQTLSDNIKKPQTEKYSSSQITDSQKQELANKIIEIMEKDKPYLDVNLTLNSFSEKLNTNILYVSHVINETFNKNFTNFINEYRVKEARRLLSDAEYHKYTLEAVAQSVGFNSRSTFIDSFKKYTGINPSFYRKTIKNT